MKCFSDAGKCKRKPVCEHACDMRMSMSAAPFGAWALVPVDPPDLLLNSFLAGYGARGGNFNAMHLRDRARAGYRQMLASIEVGRQRGIEPLTLPPWPAPMPVRDCDSIEERIRCAAWNECLAACARATGSAS